MGAYKGIKVKKSYLYSIVAKAWTQAKASIKSSQTMEGVPRRECVWGVEMEILC